MWDYGLVDRVPVRVMENGDSQYAKKCDLKYKMEAYVYKDIQYM